jgi:hypothetical protein
MKIELPHLSSAASDKLDRSDLIDRVIGSLCLAVGAGLLLWAGLGILAS